MIKVTVTANDSLYATIVEYKGEKSLAVSSFSQNVSLSRINSAMRNDVVIDNIFILKDSTEEKIFSLLRELNASYSIKNVYVNTDEDFIITVKKYFESINVYSIGKFHKEMQEDLFFDFDSETEYFTMNKGDINIAIVPSYDKMIRGVGKLSKSYNLTVCYDNAELVKTAVKTSKLTCYERQSIVPSPLKEGNLFFSY